MIEHVINNFRRAYQKKQAIALKIGWLPEISFSPVLDLLEKTFAIWLVLLVWELAPRLELIDSFLLPPFSEVIQSLFRMISTGEIFKHFTTSITRSVVGFFAGIGIAITLGIFMGWYSKLEEVVDPLVQA